MSGRHSDRARHDAVAISRRRILIPVLTIAVAAGIFGWSRWTAPQRSTEIRELVTTLVAEADPMRPARGAIPGTDPAIAPIVRDALAVVRRAAAAQSHVIGIDVRPDDHASGDGSATHHAVVSVGARPHTILRVRHAGRAGIRIIGVNTEAMP